MGAGEDSGIFDRSSTDGEGKLPITMRNTADRRWCTLEGTPREWDPVAADKSCHS